MWIDVKKRMPESMKSILFLAKTVVGLYVFAGRYDDQWKRWEQFEDPTRLQFYWGDEVSHWMEKPDPSIFYMLNELSDRELQVSMLVARGYRQSEIADMMHFDRRTINTYCKRAADKFGLEDVSDLPKYLAQSGLGSEA